MGRREIARSRRALRRPACAQFESLEDRCLLARGGFALEIAAHTVPAAIAHEPAVEYAGVGAQSAVRAARGTVATEQLPDLIVWASEEREYLYGWHIDTEESSQPGRRLLRFSNAIANIGIGPLELRGGDTTADGQQRVFQRIYSTGNRSSDREAGLFTFHPAHSHIHFDDYAQYNLRAVTEGDGVGDVLATGGKTSFCLLDVALYDASLPGSPRSEQYESCGATQGISIGWADVYDSNLADQWIDVTDIADGVYWLESVVDPSDRLVESNEANNVTRIKITLGPPPADDVPNTFDSATPITLNTNGATTQSGVIGVSRDVDVFSFVAHRKGKLTITQTSPGSLDSVLVVFDASRQEIARSDDSGNTLHSRVRIRVKPGQTFFVQAGGYQTDTGSYQLTIAFGRGARLAQSPSANRIGLKALTELSHSPDAHDPLARMAR